MTKAEIDAVFERVRTWPPEQQEDAAWVLLEMEARGAGVYKPDQEELAAIDEIERGEVATDEVRVIRVRHMRRKDAHDVRGL